jgi:PAS domain S-box-containing protein
MENSPAKILYIDDESPSLFNFEQLFQDDFDVYTANSAIQGMEILEKNDIQIIISDQRMPDKTGIEFFAEVAQLYPYTIRILLTAYAEVPDVIDAINVGQVYQYITKPFDTKNVKNILDKASLNQRLKKQNEELIVQLQKKNKEYEKINEELLISNKDLNRAKNKIEESEKKLSITLQAVASEKERLAVTLRSIGDGVITTDTLGNIVIVNKVAERLCGWNQDEAQGKPITSVFIIINENTRKPYENPIEKVISTGLCVESTNDTLLISREENERIIAYSSAPIKDNVGKTIGAVLVFRDITEKQKMIDNMQRIDKLDSIGVLAGGIAHDFNNLLGGIFAYMEMAREESAADKTVSKYLDKALSVFERAKDLTQQLLTFSKGGAPKRKTGQLGPLVKENAAFVLSGSNIRCDFNIAQDLRLCDFDENQIGQVIDNVIINAQQAMPVGGTITVSVNNISIIDGENPALKGGNYVEVSIADTGIGIPHDLLKRIFDPFFTTKQKGNGLGLATCFSIVQKHEGCIEVESVLGKGSVFHIFLPASQKGTLQNSTQSHSQHRGTGSILVMDDEDFMREIVGEMLTTMGYTLIKAKEGEEALRLCAEARKNGKPLIGALFDLTVPGGMGGKEAIVELRKDFPDLPVFASSGFSEDPIMARPAEFGFTDSIRKPFKKGDLAEMLNKHLGNRK